MNLKNLSYESYSTGRYGPKNCYQGVTLHFICNETHDIYYVIFNVNLDRTRNIGSHLKGTPLPKGRFRVSRRSAFFQFWVRAGLPIPPRLSAFHDYMGNLKGRTFTASIQSGKKLDKCSIRPLTTEEIEAPRLIQPNNLKTIPEQPENKIQTAVPNNALPSGHYKSLAKANLDTYSKGDGKSHQGKSHYEPDGTGFHSCNVDHGPQVPRRSGQSIATHDERRYPARITPIIERTNTSALDRTSVEDEKTILNWLAYIGEKDRAIIDELLTMCNDNAESRANVLMIAKSGLQIPKRNQSV